VFALFGAAGEDFLRWGGLVITTAIYGDHLWSYRPSKEESYARAPAPAGAGRGLLPPLRGLRGPVSPGLAMECRVFHPGLRC
jgi:hypothetical protein